jgi:pseudolysin
MSFKISRAIASILVLIPLVANAAKMVDMRMQPTAVTPNSLIALPANRQQSMNIEFKQISNEVDAHGNRHIRYKEFYLGVPVWGGESIQHIPSQNASIKTISTNGIIFQDLNTDLSKTPPAATQISAAEAQAINLYKSKTGKAASAAPGSSQLFVYVDEKHVAHWVVHVNLSVNTAEAENPNYLIDTANYKIYQEWNGINFFDQVKVGGLGGNKFLGQTTYDGLPGNKAALNMQRDSASATCLLQNDFVEIRDGRTVTDNNPDTAAIMTFSCPQADPAHGNIYWDGALDPINDAWSPANDALFLVDLVNTMYIDWFQIPVIHADGTGNVTVRKKIPVRVHDAVVGGGLAPFPGNGNAHWDPTRQEIVFGDNDGFWGDSTANPFVVPGVVAHELSHAFTTQHSNLFPLGEPGGLNESFSDMADAALEFYLTGHNTWEVSYGLKKDGSGLRYMDNPPKDGVSIDNVKIYYERDKSDKYTDSHLSSGIFNKVFYLLSQPKDQGGLGDPKAAFALMVQANRYHWNGFYVAFKEAACGVYDAAVDLKYDSVDLAKITQAMAKVGLDTSICHLLQ